MTIPKRLKILGKYFSVTLTEAGDYGSCDIEKCEITVRSTQNPQQMKDTLLHETIHAISDMLDLKYTEKQVHLGATGIYALLHDNKHFAKWLMEKNKDV
jgi:hypothetical protein